ncbi:hypothetical protein [uncultured Sphingosinicella sp.]|uniref:hypothetical protein n=1 Tax=uncultured Sphingosinicella sp. TaxID=478748 RepID=UPI0030D8F971|tara:strand:- start:1558 stop:2451 length:894 start_codon:yes stop_codon:yes gene_type:complete
MLFDGEQLSTDHRYFQNLGKTDFRPDIAAWCEATFERAHMLLDDDFPVRFRRETPQRISELLFAGALLDAGWKPLGRVPGFDLAFEMSDGRLLVEITTPESHSANTWTEKKGDGYSVWSTDAKTEDAALRRLTSGFANKAEAIRKHYEAGEIAKADYVVIAISGFRLSQESPVAPGISGPVPDFAKAFLPIGSRYVTVQIGDHSDKPLDGGWQSKATIEQEGKQPVDRDFFLRSEFQHIHAVAYTPLHFGEPISPVMECAALHNPMARSKDQAVALGLGCEYGVEIGDNEFSIGPLK